MSEEHKYRYKIFREALIALLLSVLLGLGAAITLGLWWGLATATGLTATIILLAYKALANISAKARVAMLALQTLGTGFTVAIAAQPLRNWLATIAAEWLNKQGLSLANLPDPIEPLPLFAILAATATVCTIGYFIFDDGAKKTDISESAASPNIHTSLDTGATDDRVALGLPSPKTVLVASIVYLAGILGVGLYIHYNVTSLTSAQAVGLVQFSLALGCIFFWFRIWLVSRAANRFVRENISFWAIPMLLSVAGIWIAFGVAGTTPFMWLREVLQQVVGSSRLEHVQDIRMHFIEMSALTILPTVHLQNVVRTWDGCKSAEHHQSEERKAEWTWLSECIRAWRWASSARKWVAIHRKPSYVYSAPLETPSEPVTWPLRGFELVRLNKRELDLVQAESFPHATCWIGRHRSSGESVAVFVGPAGVDPDEHVKHLERHLPDILKSREDRITRVIMVTDMPHPDPPTALFGRRMEWIDEGELLATLVDFRNYRADIRRRVESIPIANSTRTLRETYVPCAVNFGRSCSNVEEYLDSWLEEPGRRHVALLGEFGMGKSTTVLMWTYRWILSASFDGQRLPSHFRIPIIIELRGLSPRHNSPDALLASWAMRYQADPNAVRHLVAAGRVVLVLEGFDETAFQGNEDARIAHFRTLWKLAYPRAKLLFTGRPNFFVNPTERENALRLHQPRGDSPYCVAITLRCLSIRQIESALRDQDQRVREQIVARAKRYTRFRDLVSRPTLLHAVATMWEEHGLHGLPDEQLTSARVMRLFVRHSDLREGLKEEGDTPYQPVLTREERAYFMSGVACAMLARALPNQITGDELEQLIENLFDAMPEVISAPHQPLRERVGTDYEVRHGMHTDIRTTGLLVEDGAKAGAFKFAHKSYMEYLAAEQIASGMADALNASSGAIRFVTQIGIGNLRDQPDVMLFCAEALADLASGRAGSSGSVAKGLYAVFRGGWMTRTLRAGLFRRWIRQGLSNQRKLADPATLLLDNQIVVPIFGVLIVLSVAVVCVTLALVLGGPSERSSEGSIAVTIMVVSTATLSLFQSSLLERRVERIYQEFVLWVLACLRSGVSRPDIVSSLGISRDGVDCDLPILPVSTARIRKLVIRGFFDRSAVDLKTKGWRRCLLSTLPDPAELYLAKLPVDPRPAQTEVLKLSFRTGIISISLSTSTDTLAVADKAALRNLVYMLQGSSETVDRAEYIGSDPTTAISTQTEDPRQEDKEGGQ